MAHTPQLHAGRIAALALLVFAPLAGLLLLHDGPILQDPGYHLFADDRTCFGITNFGNVASNLLFLLVGAAGARMCWRDRSGAWRSWLVFFCGVTLVFFGSAYYHDSPDDSTLIWDRLPMAVAFMGLFAALLSEHLDAQWEPALVFAALLTGTASVFWWQHSGDLRIYLWVQAAPLLAIPFVVAAFPGRYTLRHYLVYGVGVYALSKIAEFNDHQIYTLSSATISGHTLKHLLAAAAVFCVLLMLRRRQSLTPVASSQ